MNRFGQKTIAGYFKYDKAIGRGVNRYSIPR